MTDVFAPLTPIADLSAALDRGQTTAAALLETALERARDPAGEGKRVYLKTFDDTAQAEAEASDRLRAAGVPARPLEGLPISVKDLFDVAGQVTTAGSRVAEVDPPATADAPIVARLRAAGAVITGRTNMTEFAYSGIGINPHFDTPANPWDRETRRIPGGSSSGAAVGVADGMAAVGIGSDTGGSVRIPSALCGLAGFKPTQNRVPLDGAFALSTSLDSIGPLAPTIGCCARVHQVIAGEPIRTPAPRSLKGLRFAVPQTLVLDGLDETVGRAFEAALRLLSEAGVVLIDLPFGELSRIPEANAKGGFTAVECYGLHKRHVDRDPDGFDPRVIVRIQRAAEQTGSDYYELLRARADIQRDCAAVTSAFDGVLMPTVPRVAPPISSLLASDEAFGSTNLAMLRNPSVGNFLDRCASTMPITAPGTAPVGLMIMGEHGADDEILAISTAVEALFRINPIG
jgi:aspartyl-tRNA(Asn)/glutamyl-tRNA(Gln) amidotransferase subunit A